MKLTDIKPFAFKVSITKPWQGRYRRPLGETSTFKLKYTMEHGFWPVVEWDRSEGRLICTACDCNSIEELVKAINKVKVRISGEEGGAFVINEFGQVIVPYIGVKYNLRGDSNICYYDRKLGSIEYPPEQDRELIRKLRKVRRNGPAVFIVNQYGLVLTKIPEGEYREDEDKWVPVYVGRINHNLWFKKEE